MFGVILFCLLFGALVALAYAFWYAATVGAPIVAAFIYFWNGVTFDTISEGVKYWGIIIIIAFVTFFLIGIVGAFIGGSTKYYCQACGQKVKWGVDSCPRCRSNRIGTSDPGGVR